MSAAYDLTRELIHEERRAMVRQALRDALDAIETEDDRDLVHAKNAADTALVTLRLMMQEAP